MSWLLIAVGIFTVALVLRKASQDGPNQNMAGLLIAGAVLLTIGVAKL